MAPARPFEVRGMMPSRFVCPRGSQRIMTGKLLTGKFNQRSRWNIFLSAIFLS
jgi:hypothetical protein